MISRAQNLVSAVTAIDHLLLGVSDLERGIAWVEERTGVRAAVGGSHPGAGTRNALLSLGSRRYLEIIAPDPAQAAYNFQIDVRMLHTPRLITWAAGTHNLSAVAKAAQGADFQVYGPRAGSRRTPSGRLLQWKSLGVVHKLGAGGADPVPFFIEWAADSPHPSRDAPAGCEVQSLEFRHPNPEGLASTFKALGIQARISEAPDVGIGATLTTPRGSVELK